MERQSAWLVLSALATAACSSPMTSSHVTTDVPTTDMVTVTDNGSDTDVQSPADRPGTQDGGMIDVQTTTDGASTDVPTTTDGSTPDVPRTEGGVANPCAPGSIVDLNARGTLTGTVTRYAGNNRGVSASPAIEPPCGSINLAQVVHRYVPRTTSRLRVSTNNTGTPANFDTVAFAQTTCGGTMSLGCNDDVSLSMRIISSAFSTTGAVTAGTPVFITVAGYSSPDTGRIGEGDYVLTVDELPLMAVGSACDTTGVRDGCAVGATCLVPSTTDGGTAGFCVADGAAMGLCRTATVTTAPCDTGLACSSAYRCVTAIPVGNPCGMGVTGACATGSTCEPGTAVDGGAAPRTCVAEGTANGACRSGTGVTLCDTGLACSIGRCVAAIPVGGSCATGVTGACAMGSTCITGAAVDGGTAPRTCVTDGASTGACRRGTGTTPCDAGLVCSIANRCLPSIAVGGACGTGVIGNCVAGSTCATGVAVDGGTSARTCVADGARGGECRIEPGMPACDAGLICNGENICVPT